MTELFFRREDTRIEMGHLESADPQGISRKELHKCAKSATSRHFRSTKPSMDEKKAMCDRLGLALASTPMAICAHNPQGG